MELKEEQALAEVEAERKFHGLGKIVTTKSIKLRVFWIILVILAFIGATVHLSIMVKSYLSYPVADISSTKEGTPVEFPSVTICNINSLSLQKISELLSSNTNEGNEMIQWLTFLNNQNELSSYQSRLESHESFYENLPNTARRIAHNITDFVLSCRFEKGDCGPKNFSLFFDSANYFGCYTFNSGYNIEKQRLNKKKIVASNSGTIHGLSLILSLNNDNPPPGGYGLYDTENKLQFGAGARVHIHAAGTMPSPANQGFDVSPGFSTSVGVEAVLHSRLNKPHGNCTTENLKLHREYRNTMSTCLQICKQNILVNRCGCKKSGLTMFHETDPLVDNVPYCGEIKEFLNWTYISQEKRQSYMKTLACEEDVLKDFMRNGIDEKTCGCFQPCDELSYRTSISTSYWPLEFYQLHLLETLYTNKTIPANKLKEAYDILKVTLDKHAELALRGIHVDYNQSELIDLMRASTLLRQNLIRLNVYVQNLRTTEFKKAPTYGIFDLLADVGGTLGLWLGISFLTILELIGLKARLKLFFFDKKATSSSDDKSDDTFDNDR